MKASELRINNFVYQLGGDGKSKIVSVVGIHLSKDRDDEIDTAYIEQLNPIVTVYDKVAIDKIAPVDLTQEWLLKFGFDGSQIFGTFSKEASNGALLEIDYKYRFFYSTIEPSTKFEVKCEYVHQLQNLYFALTGEELIYT